MRFSSEQGTEGGLYSTASESSAHLLFVEEGKGR